MISRSIFFKASSVSNSNEKDQLSYIPSLLKMLALVLASNPEGPGLNPNYSFEVTSNWVFITSDQFYNSYDVVIMTSYRVNKMAVIVIHNILHSPQYDVVMLLQMANEDSEYCSTFKPR